MTIKTFFTILAVLSFLFGVGFVLAPDQVLANYGIVLNTRPLWRCWGDYSAVTLGAILWLARDFRDEAAVRAVLIGGLVGTSQISLQQLWAPCPARRTRWGGPLC